MNFFFKYRKLLFWTTCGLTAFFTVGIFFLRVDFSFESFYPKDDPEYAYYDAYRKLFDEEQNFILQIAVKSSGDDVFDQAFLEETAKLFRTLRYLPGIDSAVSATDAMRVQRRGLRFTSEPWLQYDSPEALAASKTRLLAEKNLEGIFISRDQKYLCAYLFTDPKIFDTPERDRLNEAIEFMLDRSGNEYLITGIPYIRTQYVRKLIIELAFFLVISFVLILLALYFIYRNFWGVFIPIMIVLASLIWITGFMGYGGQGITLINNLIIPIMFVVGMSDIIHLVTKYFNELRKGNDRELAMQITLREIGLATFLTSATTAIGFASLITSRVPPIREFGFHAALAVMFAFFITICALPYLLLQIKAGSFSKGNSLDNLQIWRKWSWGVYFWVKRRPKTIVAIAMALILVSILALSRISLDMYMLEDISKRDPIYKTMRFFEEQAQGIRPFEMAIEAKAPHTVRDLEVIREIEKIQYFLASKSSFSPFVSIATLLQEGNYIYHGNRPEFRKLPESQSTVDEMLDLADTQSGGRLLKKFVNDDRQIARISARMPDIGSTASQQLNAELAEFVQKECNTELFNYRLTGLSHLTENNLEYLRNSLIQGLGLSFICIAIIMGLLFKSWRMLIISIIPNVIPLLITGGIMGVMGIHLTASTAIVFVISFGIAVDDTIHFLTRYRLERSLGRNIDQSIRNSIVGTGKAMILTSLVLAAGFILLLASSFGGTFSIGLFSAITIITALLADLFITPLLIYWLEKREVFVSKPEPAQV